MLWRRRRRQSQFHWIDYIRIQQVELYKQARPKSLNGGKLQFAPQSESIWRNIGHIEKFLALAKFQEWAFSMWLKYFYAYKKSSQSNFRRIKIFFSTCAGTDWAQNAAIMISSNTIFAFILLAAAVVVGVKDNKITYSKNACASACKTPYFDPNHYLKFEGFVSKCRNFQILLANRP